MTIQKLGSPIANKVLPTRLGVAKLTKMAYSGVDLQPLWAKLSERVLSDPADAGALMDLSLIAQLTGNSKFGTVCQQQALASQKLYRLEDSGRPTKLRLLAFCAAVDIGGNTPLEFLVQDSDVELLTLFVVPGAPIETVPDHDVAFVAVPYSDANRSTLDAISQLIQTWPRPVLNAPEHIPRLDRDQFYALVGRVSGIVIPPTLRVDRQSLLESAADDEALAGLFDDATLPFIIRPVGSQAGRGLDKIDAAPAIGAYLSRQGEDAFFLSPFVDYSGSDGMFRKYRIVFIAGRAYPCHMAIGTDWSLWYLNAAMETSAEKRAEEERFMVRFDQEFGARHRAALDEIARRVGLDYFGIDCAETADGKLLLFEGDISMIVHDMDPPDVFPYKKPQMRAVFDAFVRMLYDRVRSSLILVA
jgi:hypothetical protein